MSNEYTVQRYGEHRSFVFYTDFENVCNELQSLRAKVERLTLERDWYIAKSALEVEHIAALEAENAKLREELSWLHGEVEKANGLFLAGRKDMGECYLNQIIEQYGEKLALRNTL